MEKKNKVSVLSSIKTKILLLVLVTVLATFVLSMWTVLPLVENSQTTIIKNYMNDVTFIAGRNIDKEIELLGAENVLTVETLDDAIRNVNVEDMDSSYAYVVAPDGTMLYHPTADKIGQPVENDAVKHLLSEISKGNRPETDIITYELNGIVKYASYYIGENMDYVVVLTTDEDDARSGLLRIFMNSLYSAVFILVLSSLIGLFVSARFVRPIRKITEIITGLSEMDFTENANQAYVNRRKDETGVMGRSIDSLRKELIAVVGKITDNSDRLYEASGTLSASAGETSTAVEQIEKAISEIAQGATSQAQETQSATEDIILMGNMIEETGAEVDALRDNAQQMRDAGDKAIDILSDLSSINEKTKEAIDVVYDQTNTTNVSAMKIKEATDIISEIAAETNLLSLNAAIEAARAGEQGRGFAVVATQIQKLAEQSNESARQIDEIIHSLIADSEKSVATMKDVKAVIEQQNENVINTENAFQSVKTGIDRSTDSVRVIAEKTQALDEARVRVVDVVQNLNAVAQQNAASTEETSASSAEAGTIVVNIADNAKQLNSIATELEESIKMFIVE